MLPAFYALAATVLVVREAAAAPPDETIFASTALILTGEHTPTLLAPVDEQIILTGRGAQQLNAAGRFFRQRYISTNASTPPQTIIPGISTNTIKPAQLYFLSYDTQYNDASAQSFLQTLYPPYNSGTSNDTSYPMNGYQYGWIHAASDNDPESIFVDGTASCQALASDGAWMTSQTYLAAKSSSAELYSRIAAIAATNDVPVNLFTYGNADLIYEFVKYAYETNTTVSNGINSNMPRVLDDLRYLADDFLWHTYGSVYPRSMNRVAGQTAASAVLNRLGTNMASSGQYAKLSLLFANVPAFISLASFLDLPATEPNFRGAPQPGSALVFELFANNVGKSAAQSAYPSDAQMRARVLFRNGTNASTDLTPYMMNDSGDNSMSWTDFVGALSNFAIGNYTTYCRACDAWQSTAFCLAANETARNAALHGLAPSPASGSTRMDPALAGAIGAVATLAALGLFLILGVGCCGLRLVTQRHPPPAPAARTTTTTSTSARGGFKGMQKLSSDPDLRAARTRDAGAGIAVVTDAQGGTVGHARAGSWELKETAGHGRARSVGEESRFEGGGEGEGLGRRVEPVERV